MNSKCWSGNVGAPRPWRPGRSRWSRSGRAAGTERAASGAVVCPVTSHRRPADGGRDVGGGRCGGDARRGRPWSVRDQSGAGSASVARRARAAVSFQGIQAGGSRPPRPHGATGSPESEKTGLPSYRTRHGISCSLTGRTRAPRLSSLRPAIRHGRTGAGRTEFGVARLPDSKRKMLLAEWLDVRKMW